MSDNYSQYTDEDRERFIKEIYKSSKHTFNLLENLLTWANLQQQRIKTNSEKFNIKSFVDETISPYLLNAELKGIKVSNNIPDDLFVLADRFSINSAIANLVSNAIKFTLAKGEVQINATNENSHVKITVRDTGVGMEKKVAESLFLIEKAFSTVGTNNENGTGLGLVLCKEFIELNGGKIWVESKVGRGSTFSFQLKVV